MLRANYSLGPEEVDLPVNCLLYKSEDLSSDLTTWIRAGCDVMGLWPQFLGGQKQISEGLLASKS